MIRRKIWLVSCGNFFLAVLNLCTLGFGPSSWASEDMHLPVFRVDSASLDEVAAATGASISGVETSDMITETVVTEDGVYMSETPVTETQYPATKTPAADPQVDISNLPVKGIPQPGFWARRKFRAIFEVSGALPTASDKNTHTIGGQPVKVTTPHGRFAGSGVLVSGGVGARLGGPLSNMKVKAAFGYIGTWTPQLVPNNDGTGYQPPTDCCVIVGLPYFWNLEATHPLIQTKSIRVELGYTRFYIRDYVAIYPSDDTKSYAERTNSRPWRVHNVGTLVLSRKKPRLLEWVIRGGPTFISFGVRNR